MSKVDWITWKTDPKEILNPNIVTDNMDHYFEDYNTYMNPIIYEPLKHEILKGGLSKDSFHVFGKSPSNELAIDMIRSIEEIKRQYESLRASIYQVAEEQQKIEKKQLIQAIEDKIQVEKKLAEEIQLNHIENAESLDIVSDRIRKLEEKLEYVQTI